LVKKSSFLMLVKRESNLMKRDSFPMPMKRDSTLINAVNTDC